MAYLQWPSKVAAEVQTKTGYHLILIDNELPYQYAEQPVAMYDSLI
jgi:hypothetical protein